MTYNVCIMYDDMSVTVKNNKLLPCLNHFKCYFSKDYINKMFMIIELHI